MGFQIPHWKVHFWGVCADLLPSEKFREVQCGTGTRVCFITKVCAAVVMQCVVTVTLVACYGFSVIADELRCGSCSYSG